MSADNSRRILTDYGFEGHPLRKDFPLTVSRTADQAVGQADSAGLLRGQVRRGEEACCLRAPAAHPGVPKLRRLCLALGAGRLWNALNPGGKLGVCRGVAIERIVDFGLDIIGKPGQVRAGCRHHMTEVSAWV